MAYWQWGQADSPHVVLCVHGLTRQGRDFDVLAQALVAQAGAASSIVSVGEAVYDVSIVLENVS